MGVKGSDIRVEGTLRSPPPLHSGFNYEIFFKERVVRIKIQKVMP
jgi:hypothetical protein